MKPESMFKVRREDLHNFTREETSCGRASDRLPDLEFLRVSDEQRIYRLFFQEANYLQVLEGGIDPTHVMWLHSPCDLADEEMNDQQPAQQKAANKLGVDKTPEDVELLDHEAGFTYGAKRSIGAGKTLWRVNQFILPFYTMPPGADQRAARAFVPVDDENCIKWQVRWYPSEEIAKKTQEQVRESFPEEAYDPPTNSVPFGHIRMKAKRSNDYLIDWETHKNRRIGIAGVNLQDIMVTENEGPGPIMDRTREHLCAGDISTIKARLKLINAAQGAARKGHAAAGRTRSWRLPRARRFDRCSKRSELAGRGERLGYRSAAGQVIMATQI